MKRKTIYLVLGAAMLFYGGFLVKKAFLDEGYPNESVEKEILLGYYVNQLGLQNTKENRDKFRNMTLKQLEDSLGVRSDDPNK